MARKFDEFFTGGKRFGNEGTSELTAKIEEGFAQLSDSQTQTFELVGGLFQAMRHMYEIVTESTEREKRFEAQIKQLISDIATVKDTTTDALSLVKDAKQTHYVGKGVELLDKAVETVQSETNEEIRRMIVRSARRYPKGAGFNILYAKLKDVSNGEKDVFAIGETNISDGQLEKYGTKGRGKSFLNTVFANGWQYELAVIAKGDMYEGVNA